MTTLLACRQGFTPCDGEMGEGGGEGQRRKRLLSEERSGILPGTHACVLMVRQNAAERSQVATALLKTTVPNKMHYFSSSTVFCHHILVFLSLSFLRKVKQKTLHR